MTRAVSPGPRRQGRTKGDIVRTLDRWENRVHDMLIVADSLSMRPPEKVLVIRGLLLTLRRSLRRAERR